VLAAFAIVVAILIRRAQLIAEGREDPIPPKAHGRRNTSTANDLIALEEAEHSSNKALLRLVYVLEKGAPFPGVEPHY
jgi:hypothetical protein